MVKGFAHSQYGGDGGVTLKRIKNLKNPFFFFKISKDPRKILKKIPKRKKSNFFSNGQKI